MHESFSCRAAAAGVLLAALGLTGCGKSRQDVTPSPGVDPLWVTNSRKNAAKPPDGDKTAKTGGGDSGTSGATAGWGSLKGRFIVTGTVPALREITVTANPEYCDPFKAGGELRNETVVVSANNELKNVVVYLTKKPSRVHEDYKKNETAEVVLDNHKCRFEPHVTLLRTTQTLRIKNSDPVGHNTLVDSFLGQGFNESIAASTPGTTKQLAKAERFPIQYSCKVHPWMKGHLAVLPHPYVAVSGDDGSFEIKNLPAGELEFQLWHEAPGELEIGDWKKGRAKIVIKPGEATDLKDISVPAEKLKGA